MAKRRRRVSITTRRRWFDLGARAVRPYLTIAPGVDPPPLYLCPECMQLFDEDSVTNPKCPDGERLTVEDVPSMKLGGAPMLLTCKACNSTAGTRLDSQAIRGDLYQRLTFGGISEDERIRSRLTFPGIGSVLADFVVKQRAPMFRIKNKGARSEHIEAVNAGLDDWLRRAASNGTSFHWTAFDAEHIPAHNEASWLRSAYLAVCAQFGYLFARHQVYEAIRRQIRHPKARLGLRPFVFRSPWPGRWNLVLIPPGSEMSGVAVLMGKHFVHLPLPGDFGFWPRFHKIARRKRAPKFAGRGLVREWPTQPTFELDFAIGRGAHNHKGPGAERQA